MFYNNYVRLCNSIKKTPSAVALEIGIAKPTVSRWKSGSKPNHATIVKVADYFDVPVSELAEEQKETPPEKPGVADPNKQALFDVIDRMSAAELVLLLERAERIIESRG